MGVPSNLLKLIYEIPKSFVWLFQSVSCSHLGQCQDLVNPQMGIGIYSKSKTKDQKS